MNFSPDSPRATLRPHVALVGAGMAGAACAHGLLQAGFEVTVFEKSRGAGGRMATRRAHVADEHGHTHTLQFDHGAPAFSADHPAFAEAVTGAQARGLLAWWPSAEAWVVQPDQPGWARSLLAGASLQVQHTVCGLTAAQGRWMVDCAEHPGKRMGPFEAVVLAIPAMQAAVLLDSIRQDWAQEARSVAPQARWTLMAARATCVPRAQAGPELIRPQGGPLETVLRNSSKPGRNEAEEAGNIETWVAHATAAWTLQHLEAEPEQVRATLVHALDVAVSSADAPDTHTRDTHAPDKQSERNSPNFQGRWCHAVVHRWRYAVVSPQQMQAGPGNAWAGRDFLWDPQLFLGVAGDAFSGPPSHHTGVQRAWLSGTALAARLIECFNEAAGTAVTTGTDSL